MWDTSVQGASPRGKSEMVIQTRSWQEVRAGENVHREEKWPKMLSSVSWTQTLMTSKSLLGLQVMGVGAQLSEPFCSPGEVLSMATLAGRGLEVWEGTAASLCTVSGWEGPGDRG